MMGGRDHQTRVSVRWTCKALSSIQICDFLGVAGSYAAWLIHAKTMLYAFTRASLRLRPGNEPPRDDKFSIVGPTVTNLRHSGMVCLSGQEVNAIAKPSACCVWEYVRFLACVELEVAPLGRSLDLCYCNSTSPPCLCWRSSDWEGEERQVT